MMGDRSVEARWQQKRYRYAHRFDRDDSSDDSDSSSDRHCVPSVPVLTVPYKYTRPTDRLFFLVTSHRLSELVGIRDLFAFVVTMRFWLAVRLFAKFESRDSLLVTSSLTILVVNHKSTSTTLFFCYRYHCRHCTVAWEPINVDANLNALRLEALFTRTTAMPPFY
jgi:hypothetical protein